jgi:Lrp/AsnC family transcriptional regulator for asnA, asnC and gidA
MDAPKVTPVDIGIIRSLRRDARKSFVKVATELRVPESTVRHRLNRLVQHGVLEFVALTNPLQMGYQIWAVVEIQGQPSRIRAIARQLAQAREVYFVGITTGTYDILVNAVFRSNADLLHFLTTTVARIPGITRTSTSTVLDVVKRTLALEFPGSPDDRRGSAKKSRTRRRRRPSSRPRDAHPPRAGAGPVPR